MKQKARQRPAKLKIKTWAEQMAESSHTLTYPIGDKNATSRTKTNNR